MSKIGCVVIGRNEGERLKKSLLSVVGKVNQIVYVDSGSTDESVEFARSLKVGVVELDLALPFTAARARNAGFYYLLQVAPDLEFVQFIDGDCEVVDGWLERAILEFKNQESLAVVCGRRRERFPESSIYNKLCDLEWDTPLGEAKACGGDAMMRSFALQEVGGFNEHLIAGEEPELCVRLRQNGWKIWRVDAEMTLHDAAMFSFSQWWKRNVRAGHAFAEGAFLHGKETGHWVKESRSNWFWGLLFPSFAFWMGILTGGWGLLLLLLYPVLGYRIYRYLRQKSNAKDALLYAVFCVLGKLPQVQGQLKFYANWFLGTRSELVEYKTAI